MNKNEVIFLLNHRERLYDLRTKEGAGGGKCNSATSILRVLPFVDSRVTLSRGESTPVALEP